MGEGLTFVMDCCNGLILRDDDYVSVVNPATRRWIRLPSHRQTLPADSDGFYYKYLAFDPTLSTHYDVLALKEPKDISEWLPPVYTMRVYSSAIGRWEERPFVREGPRQRGEEALLCCQIKDSLEWINGEDEEHGGERVALSHTTPMFDVATLGAIKEGPGGGRAKEDQDPRTPTWAKTHELITLSNNKYQVINSPPAYKYESQYYRCHLGKSKNGVHLAVVDDVEHRLQVWFLDEYGGKTEWVFKRATNYPFIRQTTDRPWIVQGVGSIHEAGLDWDSDEENAVDVDLEKGERCSCKYLELLGFHPYKDIVFFLWSSSIVVAYYFNTSKVQSLGELNIRHSYQVISEAFIYTPCWTGELS
ncbi:hypothetical protein BS78_01G115500 [Paspalum vaginatum]|nr:hypothetical protein BS78_01G115500 [Paspalum vaginatum]